MVGGGVVLGWVPWTPGASDERLVHIQPLLDFLRLVQALKGCVPSLMMRLRIYQQPIPDPVKDLTIRSHRTIGGSI